MRSYFLSKDIEFKVTNILDLGGLYDAFFQLYWPAAHVMIYIKMKIREREE